MKQYSLSFFSTFVSFHPFRLPASVLVFLFFSLCICNVSVASNNPQSSEKLNASKIPADGKQINDIFTPAEKNWLAAHPQITFRTMSSWPPMNFIDSDGNPTGIGVDFLKILEERIGSKIVIESGSFSENLESVKNKEVDALMDVTPKPEREEYLEFTQPYLDIPHVIIARSGGPVYHGAEDLKGKTIALETGFGNVRFFKTNFPEVNITEYPDTESCLIAVSSGKEDAYAGNRAVASFLITQNVLTNLQIQGKLNKPGSILTIGVRKDWPQLTAILNKTLKSITITERQDILRPWVGLTENTSRNNRIKLDEKQREWLKKHPVVRIAPDPDFPPFEFFDNKGRYVGIVADYMEEVSKQLGISFEIVRTLNWSESLQAMKSGSVDMLPANAADDIHFVQDYLFTNVFFSYPDAIISNIPNNKTHGQLTLSDMAGQEVLSVSGWPQTGYLRRKHPEIKLVEVESNVDGLHKLATGEYKFMYTYLPVAMYIIEEEGLTGLRVAGITAKQTSGATMIRKDWPELVTLIDLVYSSMPPEKHREISHKWFQIQTQDEHNTEQLPLNLTTEEKKWLKDHPVIRSHNEKNWPPFNFNRDGQPQGFSIDYLNLLAKKLGISIEYQTGPEWDEFLHRLRRKDLDVMLNIVRTEDRLKYILFTDPYIQNPNIIICKKERNIENVAQLKGLTVSVPKGFFYEELLRKKYPEVKILQVPNSLDALKAVTVGKADATLTEEAIARYLISQNMLAGLRISGEVDVGNPDLPNLRIGVRNDWPIFRDILNKAISSVSVNELLAIQQKWLALMENRREKIQLSKEEKAWLKDHNVFELGVNPARSPLELLDKNGVHQGLTAEFLQILSDRLGITFKHTNNLPWMKVLPGMEIGILDVLGAVPRTHQRESFVDFTEPYITSPLMIFSKNDHPYTASISELNDGKTAVVNGNAVLEFLKQDWPDLQLLKVDSIEEGLQAVSSGKADHYIGALMTTTYAMQQLGYADIKVSGETPYKYEICMAVRKDIPHLKNILQKGLSSISENERNAIFSKWRSIKYEHGFNYKLFWQILTVVAFILAIVFYWNRRLAVEVLERKQTEQRLLESERKSKAMSEAIHDGLVMIDKKSQVMYWNQAAEKLFDIPAEEAIGQDLHTLIAPAKLREKATEGLVKFAKTGQGPVIGKVQTMEARRKDGSHFPVEVAVSGFQVGDEWFAVGTIRDITERLKSQELLSNIRAELQQIFDNAQVGILFLKTGRKLYRCNQRAADILGYESPKEMAGISMKSIHLNTESFHNFGDTYYQRLKNGEQVKTEYKLKRKDGVDIWCSLVGKALDESSQPDLSNGVIWVIDDISEKRKAQQALKESEERVKTILSSINTGTIIIDPESRTITDVNPVTAEMIGLSPDEISGCSCHQFIYPEEDRTHPIMDHQQLVKNAERRLLAADGREIPILKTVVPVYLDGKKQYLESFVDLTNQKAVEQKLQQKLDELERFFKLTINREEKMIALKAEVNDILLQMGKKEKYTIR